MAVARPRLLGGKALSKAYSRLEREDGIKRSRSVTENSQSPRARETSRSLTPKSGRRKGDSSDTSKTLKKPAAKKAKGERKSRLEKIYSHVTG